jgi:hypothetical protein
MLDSYDRNWELMLKAVQADACIATTLHEQYVVAEPAIDVVRACGSCPNCRRVGRASTAGSVRARHSGTSLVPTSRPLSLPFNEALSFIFVDPERQTPESLLPLADWLTRHGMCDLLLPKAFAEAWGPTLGHSDQPRVFFHQTRMRGIRAQHPAAAFFPAPPFPQLSRGSVIVLSSDARDPSRPDRRLLEVVAPRARWSLDQFMDRYLE